MTKPFSELRERLLRAGIAPRYVRRCLGELADHLDDLRAEEERAGRSAADAESAALIRLGRIDDLCTAMIEQRRLQSWCARAPWAMFGMAPLFLLAAAYAVACLILWSGWRIFLPGAPTPFVRIDGFATVYFGIGRSIYYGAPILIGWGIGLVAVRQRLEAIWPTLGLVLVALIGATAQVHASRPAGPGATGRVSMDLALGLTSQDASHGLLHALVILGITGLPYVAWRLRKSRSRCA